jgi:hypothetical protein
MGWVRFAGLATVVSAVGLSAGGCGGSGTVDLATVFPKAYATTVAAKSSKVSLMLDTSVAGKHVAVSGQGAFDWGAKAGKLTMQIDAGGPAVSLDEIIVGNGVYVQLPAQVQGRFGGKQWLGVSTGALSSGNSLGADPSQALALLESHSTSVAKVGSERIDGVDTTHYQAQLDLTKAAAGASPEASRLLQLAAQAMGTTTIPVDVWIDSAGKARRIVETVTLTKPPASQANQPGAAQSYPVSIHITLNFSDYGVPVVVTAPPASQVINVPLSQLLGPGGIHTN